MYSAHCVQFAVYSLQSTVYSVKCAVYSVQCARRARPLYFIETTMEQKKIKDTSLLN